MHARGGAPPGIRSRLTAEFESLPAQRQYLEGWRAWALEIRLRRKEEEEQARREAGEWARKERLQLALELGPKLQGVWAKKEVSCRDVAHSTRARSARPIDASRARSPPAAVTGGLCFPRTAIFDSANCTD